MMSWLPQCTKHGFDSNFECYALGAAILSLLDPNHEWKQKKLFPSLGELHFKQDPQTNIQLLDHLSTGWGLVVVKRQCLILKPAKFNHCISRSTLSPSHDYVVTTEKSTAPGTALAWIVT